MTTRSRECAPAFGAAQIEGLHGLAWQSCSGRMSTRSVRPMADTGSNMSTLTALAPALETQRSRASAIRMAIVTIVYLAIVLAAAIYPLVSPLSDYWNAPVLPLGQAVDILTGLTWLAVLLISMARQLGGRLWKLIFLVVVTQRIEALEYVPNSLVWSVARVTELVGIAFFIHLLVAFPSGVLRDRFDRLVVGWAYLLVAAWTLKELVFVGDWFTSAATRNASETCSSSGPMTSCTSGFATPSRQSPRSRSSRSSSWPSRAIGALPVPPLAGPSCRSSSPFPYGWCWERWGSSAASSTISPASTSSTARPAPSSGGAPP